MPVVGIVGERQSRVGEILLGAVMGGSKVMRRARHFELLS